MGWQHFGAAAVDGRAARDLQHAIDRKGRQSRAVTDENEAVLLVERRRGGGPVRFSCLPVNGDDAVHGVHHRLLVDLLDPGGVRETVNAVVGPGRGDRFVLASWIPRHGATPALHVELYSRVGNGLKDNMPSNSAKSLRPDPREKVSARRIAMVAFPGVTLLDLSGPAQVFAELQEIELPSATYSLSYLSTAGGLVPTDVGMMIDTVPISSVRPNQIDTLVIPGGPGIWELRQDGILMDWISQVLPKARRVASVCLGAFVLAWTGVLDGKRAVTHWRYCPRLADGFSRISVEPNAIFVKDGRVWTSAGVSAGIDLALAMIEEDFGHTTALDVARRLVVFLKRPGGQSQFSTVLAAQASDVEGRFSALHAWIT